MFKFFSHNSEKLSMKLLILTIHISLLLTMASCSRQFKIAKVVPGQTHVDTALYYLDEPVYAEHSTLGRGSQIYIWDDVSVQVSNEIVTAVHRKPAEHEETLQFWQQHYKNSIKKLVKVTNSYKTGEELWQLDLPQYGLNVIYDERNDKVIKVVKYEIK